MQYETLSDGLTRLKLAKSWLTSDNIIRKGAHALA
jgi:hypothetical protein